MEVGNTCERAMKNAWDRLPDETDKAFRAFSLYLHLPPGQRSVQEAARLYAADVGLSENYQKNLRNGSGPHQNFRVWTKKNRWRERASAFDLREHKVRLAATAHTREVMQIALYDQLLEVIGIQGARTAELTPAELTQWSVAMRGHLREVAESRTPEALQGAVEILLHTRPGAAEPDD